MAPRRLLTLICSAVAVLAGFAARPALAKQVQGPMTPKPGTPVQQAPEGTFRVRVALVSTPVVVMNMKGEPILDLQQKDFHIRDEGVEQTIESFDLGGAPLSAVLLFETSSRVAPLLPAVQKSAIVFTETVVGTSGEAAVMAYDSNISHLLPFSTDNEKIQKTIAGLQPGDSGARLYDALANAVALLRERPSGQRRALIVVGEAIDMGSSERLGRVLRDAQLANIVIYGVGLSTVAAGLRSQPSTSGPIQATPPGTFGGPPVPGTVQTPTTQEQSSGNINLFGLAEWAVRNVTAVVKDRPLEVAATATGGTAQSTFRDNKIQAAVDAIGGELNSQYVLNYRPKEAGAPGYHRIRVTVDRPGVKVRTRPGYFLEGK
jgi:VWFA-related protein